jgi:hypothetical protein
MLHLGVFGLLSTLNLKILAGLVLLLVHLLENVLVFYLVFDFIEAQFLVETAV